MIIYWNRNIAGTHRGQNFMIKGQKFLQWYVSGRNIVSDVIDIFLFNSYIETETTFESDIGTTTNIDSHIETTTMFKSEVK